MNKKRFLVALSSVAAISIAGMVWWSAHSLEVHPTFTPHSVESIHTVAPLDLAANFAFAAELQEMVRNSAAVDDSLSGFGSVVPNKSDGSADVYWRGQLPSEVQALETKFAAGVTVRNHEIENSFDELARAVTVVVSKKYLGSNKKIFVYGASVKPDCSGIKVDVSDLTPSLKVRFESALSKELGVHVEVNIGEPATAAVMGR